MGKHLALVTLVALGLAAESGCVIHTDSPTRAYVLDGAEIAAGILAAAQTPTPCRGGEDMCPTPDLRRESNLAFSSAYIVAGLIGIAYTYTHQGSGGETADADVISHTPRRTIDTSRIGDPHRARVLRQAAALADDHQCEAVRQLLALEDPAWVRSDAMTVPSVAGCLP